MKKIIIDCFSIDNHKTGVSQYGMELLREVFRLAPEEYHFHLLLKEGLAKEHELLRIIKNSGRDVSFEYHNIPAIGIKRDIKYFFLKRKLSYDLFHCLNSNLPLFISKKCTVTIHDLKFLLYPQFIGKKSFLKKKYLELLFYHAVKKAARIITVSESTKNDLMLYFGKKSCLIDRKTVPVHSGVRLEEPDLNSVSELNKKNNGSEASGKYFLYLGELRPHKNVENLVKAFICFREKNKAEDIKLVIAGKMHSSMKNLEEYASESVVFTGYIDDKDCPVLFKNSFAFYFATFYEGFGFPILEAMYSGIPVVTSNVSSMPEVAGDAALLVSPGSVEEIEKTMEMLYFDERLRSDLIEKGYRQAGKFTWEKTARETIQVYESILEKQDI